MKHQDWLNEIDPSVITCLNDILEETYNRTERKHLAHIDYDPEYMGIIQRKDNGEDYGRLNRVNARLPDTLCIYDMSKSEVREKLCKIGPKTYLYRDDLPKKMQLKRVGDLAIAYIEDEVIEIRDQEIRRLKATPETDHDQLEILYRDIRAKIIEGKENADEYLNYILARACGYCNGTEYEITVDDRSIGYWWTLNEAKEAVQILRDKKKESEKMRIK